MFADAKSNELAMAVQANDVELIERLVRQGASPNAIDREGSTLLMYALKQDRESAFRKLLALGADPNRQDAQTGYTLLHFTAMNRDSRWLRALLAAGANPNISNASLETPIFKALTADNSENVQLLLDAGADINHTNSGGYTVAMEAASVFKYSIVLTLLQNGACTKIKSRLNNDLRTITTKSVPADPQREEDRQKVLAFLSAQDSSAC